jgi:hypothetical protein
VRPVGGIPVLRSDGNSNDCAARSEHDA